MVQDLHCIVEQCDDKPWYEVTATAVLLGRKWNPVVVRYLQANSPSGFNEIETDIDDISSKALSNTLKRLERSGIVSRSVVSERPHRVRYDLTEHGNALEPVLEAMERWAEHHLDALSTTESLAGETE